MQVDLEGRSAILYVPTSWAPAQPRALIVVLHGGLGSAARIASGNAENGLNLDRLAEADGFMVAYLNGTAATAHLGAQFLAWNAGDCCGQPVVKDVDDEAYIKSAVAHLVSTYQVDAQQVFALGHSNGAMMSQKMICETDVFAAAVAVSGPLALKINVCPQAQGKRILALHGADDTNVPVAGGSGRGISRAVFRSELESQSVLSRSGASYQLEIIAGAPHRLEDIDSALQKKEGVSIAQKAVQFFGLARR
jgi:polyhydroxybutyrate depolymerase